MQMQNPRETFTSVANDSPSTVFNQTKFGAGQENPTVGLTCFNCGISNVVFTILTYDGQ